MALHDIELFLDDTRISWEYNLARRLQPPARHEHNPILTPEHPWEGSYVTIYGSVLPRQGGRGGFRMWYMSGANGMRGDQMMCYAESDDGLAWRRVMDERNVAYKGVKPTNIVLGPGVNVHGPCVILNRHSGDPAERYLALFDSYPQHRPNLKEQIQDSRWCYTATSSDGLTWNPPEGRPAIAGKSDIGQSVVWDDDNRRYIAYLRGSRGVNKLGNSQYGEHHSQRYVRASTSEDFLNWSEPVEVFRCDRLDGDPFHQAHQLSVTRRHGQYIGLLSIFRINELRPLGSDAVMEEGPIDTQLIVSRDGFNWHRCANRATFFPMGAAGQWDSHWLVTASQIVYDGDRMLFYYAGNNVPRSDLPAYKASAKPGGQYRIGVATLPRDRFQALSPHRLDQPAVIETRPLAFDGDGDLLLNADARFGSIVVELCDSNGDIIPGYRREDCSPITSDGLEQPVRWSGGKTLASAIDRTRIFRRSLRLRFYLERASLFAARWPCVANMT